MFHKNKHFKYYILYLILSKSRMQIAAITNGDLINRWEDVSSYLQLFLLVFQCKRFEERVIIKTSSEEANVQNVQKDLKG